MTTIRRKHRVQVAQGTGHHAALTKLLLKAFQQAMPTAACTTLVLCKGGVPELPEGANKHRTLLVIVPECNQRAAAASWHQAWSSDVVVDPHGYAIGFCAIDCRHSDLMRAAATLSRFGFNWWY